ncbi:MAG: hypothetical protein V1494_02735 [Candidatus Diapherotrites archaeon]
MAMEILTDTATSTGDALLDLWNSFVNVIPGLIAAIILVLIGYIIGLVLKRITVKILEYAQLDKWIEDRKLHGAIGSIKLSNLLGSLVKWWTVALFLAQALWFINLGVLSDFVRILATYIPMLAAAILFIVLGLLAGKYLRNKIDATEYRFKKTIGTIVEIVIAYIAIVIGLDYIGFRTEILLDAFRIGFTAFVLVVAVVLGITFALSYKKELQDLAMSLKK